MKASEQYIKLINSNLSIIDKGSAPILNSKREEALASFSKNGIPLLSSEKYRHTDLSSIYEKDYGINLCRVSIPVAKDLFRCSVSGLKSVTVYVVGDMPYIPQPDMLPEGVIIASLREFAAKSPELVERYYAKLSSRSTDGTVSLNTALTQDGIIFYIPDNVKLTVPLQIVNIMQSATSIMAVRRLLIIAGNNAEATVLVCDHDQSSAQTLSTQVTEIFAGENSVLQYYEIEESISSSARVSSVFVEQQAGSNMLADTITLHNGITRNNYHISLSGEEAKTELAGIAIGDSRQHIDNYTSVHHNVPACQSNELFKYILDGEAKASFRGRIVVNSHADKTVSRQSNKNICLSSSAHIYTEPQLEIYADDVKCGHGATVGQLDESALFYLRQRGIPEIEARMMLMLAFTDDVINLVRLEPLKDRLRNLVDIRLRGESERCTSCSMCK